MPAYVDYDIMSEMLSDETSLVQLGDSVDRPIYTYNEEMKVTDSNWNKFPTTENPESKYKFLSVVVNTNPDLKKINR